MPQRTFIQKKSFERPYKSIVNENPYIPSSQTYIYHSFKEFCDRVSKLKTLDDWNVTLLFERILIQFSTKPITLPQFEIIVDDSLGFTASLYGSFLPETHSLYYNYRRSIRNANIIEFVTKIKSCFICKGASCTYNKNNKIIRHSVFKGALSGLRQFLAIESPLKMMKNAFYFTSKALFILNIFKFLP